MVNPYFAIDIPDYKLITKCKEYLKEHNVDYKLIPKSTFLLGLNGSMIHMNYEKLEEDIKTGKTDLNYKDYDEYYGDYDEKYFNRAVILVKRNIDDLDAARIIVYSDDDFDKFIKIYDKYTNVEIAMNCVNVKSEDIPKVAKIIIDFDITDMNTIRKYMTLSPKEYNIAHEMIKQDKDLVYNAWLCVDMTEEQRKMVIKASIDYEYIYVYSFMTSFLTPVQIKQLEEIRNVNEDIENTYTDQQCILGALLDPKNFNIFIGYMKTGKDFYRTYLKLINRNSPNTSILTKMENLGINSLKIIEYCIMMNNTEFNQFLIAICSDIKPYEACLYGFMSPTQFKQVYTGKYVSSEDRLMCGYLTPQQLATINELDS